MSTRAVGLALVLSVLSSAGCGTAANLVGAGPGKKVPFGGVMRDARGMTEARGGAAPAGPGEEWEPKPHQLVALVLCAADLPLSLVGDVLTWPYTRSYTYINQPNDYLPIQVAPPPPPILVAPPAQVPADGRPQAAP
jgi:uncharacterized protein YceK